MSINVYSGNRLEDIAETLVEVMDANRPEDPFQRIPVVIHSSGMARWLRQELAKHENGGLSANMDLLFPGKFLLKWVFEPMDNLAGRDLHSPLKDAEVPFNPESVKWIVMKVLSEGLENETALRSIKAFLGDEDDSEIRRYQISDRIARLFDRYMSYRPEMLKKWQDGKAEPGEEWQRDLWNAVIRSSGVAKSYSNYFWDFMSHHDPSGVLEDLSKFPALYLFGLSAMPPAHLAILQKISGFVPVHFFWMNPCRELWDSTISEKAVEKEIRKIRGKDIFGRCEDLASSMQELLKDEAGNPLLGSLGRVGRELHRLLINCDGVEEDNHWSSNDKSRRLLHRLQDDILDNIQPKTENTIDLLPGDDSISVHNCYGPLREAEALYEFLIRSFNNDKTLLPRDIMVYVPDMEQYAPAIEAVFGGGGPYAKKAIPFTIADRTLTREYPSCAAFLAIVKLLGSRFKASEILAIWSFQEIRDMAGISDDDWDVLQRLLKDARVAWGIDDAFREKTSGCKFRQNSWRFALERLIFGAVMMEAGNEAVPPCFNPPHKNGVSNPEVPIAPLEDAEVYSRLIGLVADWMESLFGIQKTIDEGKVRKSYEWLEVLEQISERFLPSSREDDGVLALGRTLGSMRTQLETAELLDMEISWDLAAMWMKERIEGEANDGKFCCGMLTFCRFQPMRGVPSRIVCMLGMNDGIFPRQDKRLGFDLMDPKTRHLCDRWGKDDDRYAFLEAILSAREKLFISYTGRRDTDKQEMPPSILVGELLSYLGSRVKTDKIKIEDSITVQHPLHPFSQDYFMDGKIGLPRSSSKSWCKIAENLYGKKTDTVERGGIVAIGGTGQVADTKEMGTIVAGIAPVLCVSVRELLQFFESPCKHYYEKVVGVDLNIRESEQPGDDEPSQMDHLQQYHIRNSIYEAYKRGTPCAKDDLYVRTKAEGGLPFGVAGRKIFDVLWEETNEWLDEVKEQVKDAGETLAPARDELELDIDGVKVRLSYELNDLYENIQIVARPAKVKAKDNLNLAILYAIIQILRKKGNANLPGKIVFVGQKENRTTRKTEPVSIEIINMENPEEYLRGVASLYIEGRKRALCFWLDVADKAMKDGVFDWKKAKTAWEPSYDDDQNFGKPDEYTVKVYGEKLPKDENLEELENIARSILSFKVNEKKKYVKADAPADKAVENSGETEKTPKPRAKWKKGGVK